MPRRVQELAFWGLKRVLESAPHTNETHLAEGHDSTANQNGEDHLSHNADHSEFGVHIVYEDLYNAVVFLTCIYLSGQMAARIFRMPSLVGEIVCGIVLGPPLIDFVPNPEAWVLLGEFGLILLVLEAGIDIDLSTLKLIGSRGFLIAFIGSVLPISMAMLIAWALNITDTKGIIAAGCTFGPTSLGIALNILRSGGILNTPVGQLIISAAVIDDMIALVILSQLDALTGTITAGSVLIPIVSALCFLFCGAFVAICILPHFLTKHVLPRFDEAHHDKIEMGIMFSLVLIMMPATFYARASYLMGAFISGLCFCSFHELHHLFVRQFKRLLQWLMRVFFAASIGFQVPVTHFANGTIIWQGLVFTLALLGKLAVGFLVPNFSQSARFTKVHLRDCLITGFSMAAEGEFAFVIAVFAVDSNLISKELYSSVVLAVLLSTIIPPFCLRFTISYYNKQSEQLVQKAAREEAERQHDLESQVLPEQAKIDPKKKKKKKNDDDDESIVESIRNHASVFLCIQTQSDASWGLFHSIMDCMAKQGLHVIDHRAWHPRGINSTLVNEVYAKSQVKADTPGSSKESLKAHIQAITEALEAVINQPGIAKVRVQRWFPGVVEEIVETVQEDDANRHHKKAERNFNVTDGQVTKRLLNEASEKLELHRMLQTQATEAKSVSEILGEMKDTTGNDDTKKRKEGGDIPKTADDAAATANESDKPSGEGAPRRRRRQKMRSTPVVGGGLFGETHIAKSGRGNDITTTALASRPLGLESGFNLKSTGIAAEIVIKGETYNIRVSKDTYYKLQKGFRGEMLDSRGIEIKGLSIDASEDAPVVHRLQGYVRNTGNTLNQIKEESVDEMSEMSDSQMGGGTVELPTGASLDNNSV